MGWRSGLGEISIGVSGGWYIILNSHIDLSQEGRSCIEM
jgi:hypothetical protein